jgi:hypothetical protein
MVKYKRKINERMRDLPLFTFYETDHYIFDPGGAPMVFPKGSHSHFFHPDKKSKEAFFHDIYNSYQNIIDKHPNKLAHITGVEKIPVSIETVYTNLKKIGYQKVFPTFEIAVNYGRIVEEYYQAEKENWIFEEVFFKADVLPKNLSFRSEQIVTYYRLIERRNFMQGHEGGDYPEHEDRVFDLSHHDAISKEEFFFHVACARDLSKDNACIDELLRILCESYGYKPLVTNFYYSLTQNEPNEYDEIIPGISHDIKTDLLLENVQLFSIPEKKKPTPKLPKKEEANEKIEEKYDDLFFDFFLE